MPPIGFSTTTPAEMMAEWPAISSGPAVPVDAEGMMPRIAANLTMLFTEYPFLERFDRAAAAGFKAVEFLFPYDEDLDGIERALERNELSLVLFNLPAGDWAAGERGIACQPDRQAEFRAGVKQAVVVGPRLRVPQINCLAGKRDPQTTPEVTRTTLADNLRYAAEQLHGVGIDLLVEPVNTHDIPDFAVPTAADGFDLITRVDHPNLAVQLDTYHALRMGEDPIRLIEEHREQIAHIQVADVPGRHQPGTGEVDFRELFGAIDGAGYDGWVALEYNPDGRTEDGFGLMRELGLLPAAKDA
jgi:hydroxypyruvate isomerase